MGVAAGLAAAAVVGAGASAYASNKASKAQKSAAKTAAAETKRSTNEARDDLFKLFPSAQQTARQGFQGALDVYGQSLPAQADVFTQGNVGAQQAITQGLQQQQNALLGNQIDYSQMQPFQVQQPDLSFFQQQLPEAINPFAQPTNQSMGMGGVLPQGQFEGPIQTQNPYTSQGVNKAGGGFNGLLNNLNLSAMARR